MCTTGNVQREKMSWSRAFAGSFLAALFGWVTLNVFIFVFSLLTAPKTLHDINGIWFFTIGSGFIVLVVWIALLLPIYHEVSSESPIWRWQISTLIGAFAGYLVISLSLYASTPHDAVIYNEITVYLFNPFHIFALLCGASTGLFAGLTARYFHAGLNTPSPTPQ